MIIIGRSLQIFGVIIIVLAAVFSSLVRVPSQTEHVLIFGISFGLMGSGKYILQKTSMKKQKPSLLVLVLVGGLIVLNALRLVMNLK